MAFFQFVLRVKNAAGFRCFCCHYFWRRLQAPLLVVFIGTCSRFFKELNHSALLFRGLFLLLRFAFLFCSDPSLPTRTVLFCFVIPANLQPACAAEGGAEEEPSRGTAVGSCKTARLQMNADLRQRGATHVKDNSPESTRETAALPIQPRGSPPPGSPSFGTAPCPPLLGVMGGEQWVLRAPRPGTPARAVPMGTWGQPHTLGEEAPSPLRCSALRTLPPRCGAGTHAAMGDQTPPAPRGVRQVPHAWAPPVASCGPRAVAQGLHGRSCPVAGPQTGSAPLRGAQGCWGSCGGTRGRDTRQQGKSPQDIGLSIFIVRVVNQQPLQLV